MDIVKTNESTGYQFPQTWVVMVFLLGVGALSVLATASPDAYDSSPYTPIAQAVSASKADGTDNSRECDPDRGISAQCIFP